MNEVEETKRNTSAEIGELVKALAKVQGTIKPAKKDSENPFFKQKYASLTSIWDSCRKELSQNGLVVIQTTKVSNEVTVLTTLAHESGQWIRGELTLKPIKNDPQGVGSALTYARRYALAAIVGIASEDDDAEEATRGTRKNKIEEENIIEEIKVEKETKVEEMPETPKEEESEDTLFEQQAPPPEKKSVKKQSKELFTKETHPKITDKMRWTLNNYCKNNRSILDVVIMRFNFTIESLNNYTNAYNVIGAVKKDLGIIASKEGK